MRLTFLLLCAFMLLQACEDPFDYHPWEIDIPDDKTNLNAKHIIQLQNLIGTDTTSFNFAVVGDPHFYYDFTEDVLDHIVDDPSIRFVIVNGDLTD